MAAVIVVSTVVVYIARVRATRPYLMRSIRVETRAASGHLSSRFHSSAERAGQVEVSPSAPTPQAKGLLAAGSLAPGRLLWSWAPMVLGSYGLGQGRGGEAARPQEEVEPCSR